MTPEEKIADLKANFDYVLEGWERKVEKLQNDLSNKRISIKNKKAEIKLLGERCNQLLKDKGELTDKIADIKANCDLAIEGRDIKIMELKQQIEKMKLCQNCKSEDNDYMEKPCCDCSRCLGDIKRKGTTDKWEVKND
jgi:chromosome segregation ATPase